jgi:hypothetical protein
LQVANQYGWEIQTTANKAGVGLIARFGKKEQKGEFSMVCKMGFGGRMADGSD